MKRELINILTRKAIYDTVNDFIEYEIVDFFDDRTKEEINTIIEMFIEYFTNELRRFKEEE